MTEGAWYVEVGSLWEYEVVIGGAASIEVFLAISDVDGSTRPVWDRAV